MMTNSSQMRRARSESFMGMLRSLGSTTMLAACLVANLIELSPDSEVKVIDTRQGTSQQARVGVFMGGLCPRRAPSRNQATVGGAIVTCVSESESEEETRPPLE